MIFIILLFVFVGVYSFFLQQFPDSCSLKYFQIPFNDLLNIIVLSFVVYWFVECKNDKRKQKDSLANIALRLIQRVSNSRMYHIEDQRDIYHIRVVQRIIYNELSMLKKYENEYGYSKDIEYCKEQLGFYWDIISENIYDMQKLQEMENVLENYLACIINRIENITLKIYD